jgi:hypothetical protein
LFVAAFVELFVVGRRVSGLADDKAVSSRSDDSKISETLRQIILKATVQIVCDRLEAIDEKLPFWL